MTICYSFASRSRSDQFFDAINNIQNMSASEDYFIVAKLDEDDPEMFNDDVKKRLRIYPKVIVKWGMSASKIHAINRDMTDIPKWDILVNMSDDMRFVTYHYDAIIRGHMTDDLDSFLHFPDSYAMDKVCTMSIMGRKYYERDGYIYHSDYYSLWVDDEATAVAKIRGKYKYIPVPLIDHLHYAPGKASKDALYRRNDTYHADRLVFEGRQAKNFDL